MLRRGGGGKEEGGEGLLGVLGVGSFGRGGERRGFIFEGASCSLAHTNRGEGRIKKKQGGLLLNFFIEKKKNGVFLLSTKKNVLRNFAKKKSADVTRQ